MQFLLVAVDAKYIHTNLAVRSIAAYCKQRSALKVDFTEFTINQPVEYILEKLYETNADVIAFSCYIWNIEFISILGKELKKLMPNTMFVVGGPQVSYSSVDFLRENPAFDAVVAGEGEEACLQFFTKLAQKEEYTSCPSVAYRKNGEIIQNQFITPLSLDEAPLAYDDTVSLKDRILYYESMRGCPFGCSYCLSSVERGVRLKSLELVFKELAFLTKDKPRQIKFVDRTFNCNKKHAMEIWKFLKETDNGVTNFHFELAGEILEDEMIAFLQTVRPGLFQFEIGVQSTNIETLKEINRPAGLYKLFQRVEELNKNHNIHLHLDLIAGLPFEDYDSFANSFNQVYACKPHQFQLGFLKVLSGSAMEKNAEKYGLVYTDNAPFEVLFTKWLSYSQLVELKTIADMVERYYNSGRFSYIVSYICDLFINPFEFWQQLAFFYKLNKYDEIPLSKTGYYQFLGDFMVWKNLEHTDTAKWLCRYDLVLHEKPKAVPAWVDVNGTYEHNEEIQEFYKNEQNIERFLPEYTDKQSKQVQKMAHLEVFPFNPETGEKGECALLFNYLRRDITGRATVQKVEL